MSHLGIDVRFMWETCKIKIKILFSMSPFMTTHGIKINALHDYTRK